MEKLPEAEDGGVLYSFCTSTFGEPSTQAFFYVKGRKEGVQTGTQPRARNLEVSPFLVGSVTWVHLKAPGNL